MLRFIHLLFLAVLASSILPTVYGGQSTFVSGHGNSNITFALSVPDVSDHPNEIYFHISGPKDNSFIAFGFGVSMKKALMLIVYSNHNDKNVTLSARTSHGNTEPSFDDSINVEIINGTGIFHDRYELNGRCQNCGDKGPIDFNSTTQQMIYAIGPDNVQLNSDSGSAGLRRHEFYGRFTIDMVQAKGDANSSTNFPLAVTANDGAVKIGHEAHDRDFGSAVHAVFMAGVFVILFPIGTVWLRIFGQVRWHWITQAVGVFIIFIGAGIGLKISKEYNRAKHFNAAHQIIGFILLFLLVAQIGLGAFHHRAFKRQPRPTTMSMIHRILGPVSICLGIINGALGFKFASAPRHIIGYAIVIIFVSIIILLASIIHDRRRRRKAVRDTPAARNFQNAYVAPDFQQDIPLAQTGAPPPYSRPL